MKKELLQELATELAEILRREKKALTRDQLFMRCRDGVSLDDVIDAMTELCQLGAVRAHGGAYKFERMPAFDAAKQDNLTKLEAKPEAELPSPVIDAVQEVINATAELVMSPLRAANVLETIDGREIKAPEWMRPVHHDSVDHETIQQGKDETPKREMVNHPSHYNAGQIEVIDAIEDWQLGFSLGNAIKYIARHQHKGTPLQDLKKAMWYLQREIDRLEKNIKK